MNKLAICLMGMAVGIGNIHATPKGSDEEKNPLGCIDTGYQMQLNVLELLPESAGERNSLYFIYNKLEQPVALYHMRNDDSANSTHFNHTIRAKQWAVLSTSEKQVKYACTIQNKKSPYGKVVDCADSVKVCEYAKVKFGLNTRGNYWLVDSNTKNGAVRDVVRYGIIPK